MLVNACNNRSATPTDTATAAMEALLASNKTAIQTDDFRKVYCTVDFGAAESDVIDNRMFLDKYYITSDLNAVPEKSDWRQLDKMYQAAALDTVPEMRRNLYRQVTSIHILKNHGLLAESAEKEKVAYYTNEYVSAGGSSAGLLYHCLNQLGDAVTAEQKTAYIQAITPRSTAVIEELKTWIKNIQSGEFNETLAPDMKVMFEKEMNNVIQTIKTEQAYIDKLNEMTS